MGHSFGTSCTTISCAWTCLLERSSSALTVTDRRSLQYRKIDLGEHEIKWEKSIKYLEVQLDPRLTFGEHLQIATAKAIQCGAALTRLMPNIVGPREAKRRLVASVVNSKLLYAAPIWTSALNNHPILKKLFSAQRGVVMRIISAYRTVSTCTVLVLASVPPIDLLAEERKETFQLRKELTFGGGIGLFLPWLARLAGLPNGRVAADGSPGRTDDGRDVRDVKLKPTTRQV